MGNYTLLIMVLVPIVSGLIVGFAPAMKDKKTRQIFTACVLGLNAVLVLLALTGGDKALVVSNLTNQLSISFKVDGMSRIFLGVVCLMWICSGVYSFEYMNHEKNHERYYAFFLLSLGALNGLGLAANYMTMYLCFECMTLLTMPLVLHSQTKESIAAGIKYVMYSVFGASLGLLGLFFMCRYATTLDFVPGGTLDAAKVAGNESLLRVIFFLVVVGFGAKAGMFPLHDWLPTAHPVAPAPASAVLSGVITKAGVLAIIRVIYYQIGVDFVKGTWVQVGWLILALITVFMGSMMAFKENALKKRLAFSSVSQVSYILFGLFLMNEVAMQGALLHVLCHSIIKDALFLAAGAIIYKTHKTDVRELRGIGKEMPVTIWCFTLVSMALIGIPPLCGFFSKWYLAVGALESGVPVISYVGPVVLLISAILTAGYLFTITVHGFFPGADYDYSALKNKEPSLFMTVPMLALTAAAVLIGVYPKPFMELINAVVSVLF